MVEHLRSRRWAWITTLMVALLLQQHAHADDPPGMVAWFSEMQGTVTFSPAGTDTWVYASANRPMVSGDRVWVGQGSHAEMHIGSSAIRLGAQTLLNFAALNEDRLQIEVPQGELVLRVHTLYDGQAIELHSPDVTMVPSQAGLYRLDVSPDGDYATITVREGQAVIYGDAARSKTIYGGERVVYAGANADQYVMDSNPPIDSFDIWSARRDQLDADSVSVRYVSRELTGYQSLDTYGTWVTDPAYGPVWIPRVVSVDWAPFHQGHWAWIAPWGWTWIDDAPWGFATCHYGRWAWADSHWFWVPGPRVVRPVYAPALVAFVGGRQGHDGGQTVHAVKGHPGLAWLPLGPGEVYRPSFHAGPRYLAAIKQMTPNARTVAGGAEKHVNQQAPRAITAQTLQTSSQGRLAPAPMIDRARSPWVALPEPNGASPVISRPAAQIHAPSRPAEARHTPVVQSNQPSSVFVPVPTQHARPPPTPSAPKERAHPAELGRHLMPMRPPVPAASHPAVMPPAASSKPAGKVEQHRPKDRKQPGS